MSAFLLVDLLTDFTDFIDWRYIHSWFLFSTQLVNCCPHGQRNYMVLVYCCPSTVPSLWPSPPSPLPNVQYIPHRVATAAFWRTVHSVMRVKSVLRWNSRTNSWVKVSGHNLGTRHWWRSVPALVAQCTGTGGAVYRHWWRSVPALVAQCYRHWWRSVTGTGGAVCKGATPSVEQ